MECNKEEAIRAKSIAENKMLNKDFVGARKLVLKAQHLFPDLENMSHMLTVCEVHCSAEVKINGETDWYGILQVVPAADELSIKKQYRKLALLLHPDKNKFGGAEAAFKLVGEANRILTDQSKRALHDMKRAATFRTVSVRQPSQQPNRKSFTKKQPVVASSFAKSTFTQSNGFNQQPSAPFSTKQTFWTLCPSCGMRYEYYQTIMNRTLRCQSCKKPFIAYDLNAHAMPSAAPWNRSGVPQQEKKVPATHYAGPTINLGTSSDVGSKGGGGSATSQPWSKSGFEFGGGSHNKSKEDVKVDREPRTTNDGKFEKVKLPEVNKKGQAVRSSCRNGSQKIRKKMAVEPSESESSDSDVVIGDGYGLGQNVGSAGSNSRRSRRWKHDISYNEAKSDDEYDFVSPTCKKSRMGNANGTFWEVGGNRVNAAGTTAASMANGLHESEQGRSNDKGQGVNAGAYSNATANFCSEASTEPESVPYPDPEFCDFDKERDESKFAVNQIWALYDNLDAMPRYYALIRHVYRPIFKMRFTWLEYVPRSRDDTRWFKADLPVGCGNFKLGKSEHTQERLVFSHPMHWRKGATKNTYDIFPGKGEVWALFKNWDVEWASCVDIDRQYEYEIVEVLSDFTGGDVITAVRLVKIQGFVSLFARAINSGLSPLEIQLKDMLKFSHKIPSYRLMGNEREGIPKGSLELDCASLPVSFSDMFTSVSLESFKARVDDSENACNGLHSKSAGDKEEVPTCRAYNTSADLNGVSIEELQRNRDISCNSENGTRKHTALGSQKNVESEQKTQKQQVGLQDDDAQQSTARSSWYVYPESEFHDFEGERSTDKFEPGQIWALYSDIDKNPNYYGWISKVELVGFKVHVTWLEGCTEQEEEKHWFEEQLPIGCGIFRIIQENCVLDTTDTFSHVVHAYPTETKTAYVIYPRVGEIWAVYKNWSLKWSLSDLESCKFDLVEVIAADSSGFKVLLLTKVIGHWAVFMGERIRVSAEILDIPFTERLKFSHRIPAFRLTKERGGKLQGCWELDPASLPDLLLSTGSI